MGRAALARQRRRRALPASSVALRAAALLAASCTQASAGSGSFTPEQLAAAEHVCKGQDQEVGECPHQEKCQECTPIDCEFSEWGAWYDSGGCVGLKFRHRTVSVANNECGKPCAGAKIESARHLKAECAPEVKDCAFEAWSSWSACGSITDQAVRSRSILREPSNDGSPCEGNLRQTRPCGGPERQDCELSEWHEWTQCSASCGEGRHSRMRQVLIEAGHGGRTCHDHMLEVKPCIEQECPKQDCVLSEWAAWSGGFDQCLQHGHGQRTRRRSILQAPAGGGQTCPEVLMETTPCPHLRATACDVSAWTEWSTCTKSCLGGQKYRERGLKTPNAHGGSCPLLTLKAVEGCNDHPCESEIEDCQLGQWTVWSGCSVEVGQGAKSRSRAIEWAATDQGKGCSGALSEVASCMVMNLQEVDCVWANWDEWSDCSNSCGGGQKHRSRVVSRSAANGGAQCPVEAKREVTECGMQECDKGCKDAEWGEWLEWTDCTVSCDSGFRSRVRSLLREANECGKSVTGLREEFKPCGELPACTEDRDCKLSEWDDWGECSGKCFGVRKRKRDIEVYSAGKGAPCASVALEAVEPCPAASLPASCGAEPKDCLLSNWTKWSDCSATCGGGQQHRLREMLSVAEEGGVPCQDELTVTQPCNAGPCPVEECQDCRWEEWSEWTACERCGGQKTRSRTVKQLPTSCGAPCDERSTKETASCTSDCEEEVFCSWSEWTKPKCSGQCGQSTSTRSRELRASKDKHSDYLFKASAEAQCRGTQSEAVACPAVAGCADSCSPRNCAFGDWGEWAAATCIGLCERQRVITTMNNECGDPCDGELVATKRCPAMCDASQDCVLSSWSQWTACPSSEQGQRLRERKVLQEPQYDGVACNAPLNETRACNVPDPVPCRLQEWSNWGTCSRSCGIGSQTRTRGLAEQARDGGEQCAGSLKQMQPCSERDCYEEPTHDCVLEPWSGWSSCDTDGQRSRSRGVLRPASGRGRACTSPLAMTDTCRGKAVDCKMSVWTHWDACDRTCGAGQTRRHRQVQAFPEYGGEPCPETLLETKGCNEGPCDVQDCLVSGWTEWNLCSTSCGAGSQARHREVIRERGEGGVGCFWELGETQPCPSQPSCGTKDCVISEWGGWGGCSVECGGGFRRRLREIAQLPDIGGRTCSAEVMEEVEPCNLQDCGKHCVDGAFGDWAAWAPCSVSCEGGTTFRSRQVTRMANECGRNPEGLDREEKFCNVGVPCEAPKDCVFNLWTAWSGCSATCSGVKRRSRTVAEYGRGEGTFCLGALKETFPCNPSAGERTPQECLPAPDVDCIMSEWEGWSACSATCGGGQHVRSRSIVQHPVNGGLVCDTSLSEVRECGRNSCGGPQAVDCEFGDWEDWQECQRCDGERKRARKILSFAAHGGRACTDFVSAQVEACPRKCGLPTYCGWSGWGDWSSCSTKCGTGGRRKRNRSLQISSTPPAEAPTRDLQQLTALSDAGILNGTLRRYEVLFKETKDLEASHLQEIAAAFAAGCISVVAGLAVFRGSIMPFRVPSSLRRSAGESFFGGRHTSARSTQVPGGDTADIRDGVE